MANVVMARIPSKNTIIVHIASENVVAIGIPLKVNLLEVYQWVNETLKANNYYRAGIEQPSTEVQV